MSRTIKTLLYLSPHPNRSDYAAKVLNSGYSLLDLFNLPTEACYLLFVVSEAEELALQEMRSKGYDFIVYEALEAAVPCFVTLNQIWRFDNNSLSMSPTPATRRFKRKDDQASSYEAGAGEFKYRRLKY